MQHRHGAPQGLLVLPQRLIALFLRFIAHFVDQLDQHIDEVIYGVSMGLPEETNQGGIAMGDFDLTQFMGGRPLDIFGQGALVISA